MNPGLKYTLARFGILLVCLIPAVFLFPTANLLLKLLVAFLVSAILSFFLLRQWRDEVAEQLSANAIRRSGEKQRLRAALSGEDEEEAAAEPKHAAKEDDEEQEQEQEKKDES
jgi:flagellar biosynthesis/type III secretory pathway M-ring protein FliF/YscJ